MAVQVERGGARTRSVESVAVDEFERGIVREADICPLRPVGESDGRAVLHRSAVQHEAVVLSLHMPVHVYRSVLVHGYRAAAGPDRSSANACHLAGHPALENPVIDDRTARVGVPLPGNQQRSQSFLDEFERTRKRRGASLVCRPLRHVDVQLATGHAGRERALAVKVVDGELVSVQIDRLARRHGDDIAETAPVAVLRERHVPRLEAEVLPRNRSPLRHVERNRTAHDHARQFAGERIGKQRARAVAAFPVGGGIERAVRRANPHSRCRHAVKLHIHGLAVGGKRNCEPIVRHAEVSKRIAFSGRKHDAACYERDLVTIVVGNIERDLRSRAKRERPFNGHTAKRNSKL